MIYEVHHVRVVSVHIDSSVLDLAVKDTSLQSLLFELSMKGLMYMVTWTAHAQQVHSFDRDTNGVMLKMAHPQ